uniref:Uncharacterized protein n=1 Tax=Leersia perrieri TaxID=77586 RepID=A0A0D9Y1D1_9ORYZ
MPIILHAAAVAAFCAVSQKFNLLGTWITTSNGGDGVAVAYPVGGVACYVTPPETKTMMDYPGIVHELLMRLIHGVFVAASCTVMSMAWAKMSGTLSVKGSRRRVIGRDYVVAEETSRQIDRVIPAAAAVGVLAFYAGAIGAIGGAGFDEILDD